MGRVDLSGNSEIGTWLDTDRKGRRPEYAQSSKLAIEESPHFGTFSGVESDSSWAGRPGWWWVQPKESSDIALDDREGSHVVTVWVRSVEVNN